MKGFIRPLVAVLLVSGAASAIKVPIPVEGATLNLSAQFQPQIWIGENGAQNGTDVAPEFYLRRARVLVNGDVNQNFQYLYQIDMANAGRRGLYPSAANGNFSIVQDAWVGWAPTGITGPTVVFIDAGILLVPVSRHLLESTTNFTTADVHTDSFRGIGGMPGLRDPGIQIRGWALDKKVGFRGGLYQGVRAGAAANGAPLNPKSYPRFSGFVNFDILGSEEGAWLYQGNYWAKDPILTVGASTVYQAQVSAGPNGVADNMVNSVSLFLDYPTSENQETTFQFVGYRSNNGTASGNTGFGFFADLGVRFGNWKPYVSFEYFGADSCPDDKPALCLATPAAGRIGPTSGYADSRITRAGVNYFIDRNRNHVNAEFVLSRGLASQAFQYAAASKNVVDLYGPSASKQFVLHWNLIF